MYSQHVSTPKPLTGTLKIVGLFANNVTKMGGCEIYRITMPLYHLAQKSGFEAAWCRLDQVSTMPEADIYVFQRMSALDHELDRMMEDHRFTAMVKQGLMRPDTKTPVQDLFRLMGKRLVYEVDDDFTNQFREIEHGGERMMETARACDAVTVSTNHLASVMREQTNRPVYVCKNYVDLDAWRSGSVERKSPNLTIGLTGSITHGKDWEIMGPVLTKVLENYPEVNLTVGGYHPSYLPPISDRVQYVDYLPYKLYTATIRSMDILLCPVDPDDRFNLSKSPIKAIEGNAAYRQINKRSAGAAVIATNNPVYREWVVNEVNGLLVEHTEETWYAAIERLIQDVALRQSLSIRGYKYVRQHGSIDTGWKDWAKAYRAIARGDFQ